MSSAFVFLDRAVSRGFTGAVSGGGCMDRGRSVYAFLHLRRAARRPCDLGVFQFEARTGALAAGVVFSFRAVSLMDGLDGLLRFDVKKNESAKPKRAVLPTFVCIFTKSRLFFHSLGSVP